MISGLRRLLPWGRAGQRSSAQAKEAGRPRFEGHDAERRIDAARRRLKESIPPRDDPA